MKYSINRLFLSSRRTLCPFTYLFYLKWFSRQFNYKVPGGFHYPPANCYISNISWNSGDLQWFTLLIDCSSHRGAHFIHSHICCISNGSRDNSSTRSQGVSITRQPFVTSATITWNSCDLEWYTLLIDCSAYRGAHFIHSHICSISNGSRDNSSTMSQRVSITRQPFITSATITWDPGDLQWNTLLIDCSSRRGAHFIYWHICSISNGSRDNSSTSSQGVSITRQPIVTSAI